MRKAKTLDHGQRTRTQEDHSGGDRSEVLGAHVVQGEVRTSWVSCGNQLEPLTALSHVCMYVCMYVFFSKDFYVCRTRGALTLAAALPAKVCSC